MKRLLTLLFAIGAFAQALTVTQLFYTGSNLSYQCVAPLTLPYTTSTPIPIAIPSPPPVSIAAGTLTNIVVSGGTATATVVSTSPWSAGTWADMQITVQGSATAALNGSFQITSGNTTTTTFTWTTTAGSATYTDANLVITTNNPLLTQIGWNVSVVNYNGSNQSIGVVTLNTGYSLACSSRSNY